jgi:hypothetical protein
VYVGAPYAFNKTIITYQKKRFVTTTYSSKKDLSLLLLHLIPFFVIVLGNM